MSVQLFGISLNQSIAAALTSYPKLQMRTGPYVIWRIGQRPESSCFQCMMRNFVLNCTDQNTQGQISLYLQGSGWKRHYARLVVKKYYINHKIHHSRKICSYRWNPTRISKQVQLQTCQHCQSAWLRTTLENWSQNTSRSENAALRESHTGIQFSQHDS